MSHIRIRRIPVSSAPEIVAFVNCDFAKTEPLCEYLGTLVSEFNDVLVLKTVELGFSFEAIDTANDDKRVGVFVTTPYQRGVKTSVDLELDKIPIDWQMEKITAVLEEARIKAEEEIERKSLLPMGMEYMEGFIVSVLPDYAGLGIAGRLIKAVEDLCMEMSIGMIYVGCTSAYSAKAVAKCGFDEIYCIRYSEFLGDDGEPMFKPKPPHDALRVYIKLLQEVETK